MTSPSESTTQRELAHRALREIWGYASFRPHQEDAINAIIEGRDSLTILPTGGGKSLCYQLPATFQAGTALVISPLISLMADQVQALSLVGVPAGYLNSSLTGTQSREIVKRLMRGRLKLLYVSPERVLMDGFLALIRDAQIGYVAIDEAHCISQWGHDFRPEYRQLGTLRQQLSEVSFHALTATATPRVQDDIVKELGLKDPLRQVGSYFRENLVFRVVRRHDAIQQIKSVIDDHGKNDLGIIYCLTRKETERIAKRLGERGISALPYHAGLETQQRQANQEAFSQERIQVMVATVAFGMGIDQSNVRFVIHAGMPKSLSHYQQEAGRAGRDGLRAQCILLYDDRDMAFWKYIISNEGAAADERMTQLQHMADYAYQLRCRHRALIEHFGQDFEPKDCHACDICLGEISSIPQARLYSRMILSAILKTGERFGAGYVAQVLTGSRDKRILSFGHDRLSVYNLLSQHSKSQVHDWILQLVHQGYLQSQGDRMPVIQVTRMGLWLLRPDKFGKSESDVNVILVATRATTKTQATHDDPSLFEALRHERKQIAAEMNVPAFMVFGDRSLQDMARRTPNDKATFMAVFGVGTHKWEQFGDRMLAVIRNQTEEITSQDA